MPDELSSASTADPLEKRVERRFGILPNFFRLAPRNARNHGETLGLRANCVPRQSSSFRLQGASLRLPFALLRRSLLHRASRRSPGGTWAACWRFERPHSKRCRSRQDAEAPLPARATT